MEHPKTILERLDAGARKSFSQNFLVSPHWAERLTSAVLEPVESDIWEVGPGLGALTQQLWQKGRERLTVFELDRKLSQHLRKEFPGIRLVEGDFLKANLPEFISVGKKVNFLSNLPYHLSSPILFRLAEHRASFSTLVMTFQKEFARRLTAGPGHADYGALSLVVQAQFRVESLGILSPGCFFPPPKVDSEAIRFAPIADTMPHLDRFIEIVKMAFMHRRKKLTSNLRGAFPNAPVREAVSSLGLSENVRPEELGLKEYEALKNLLFPNT